MSREEFMNKKLKNNSVLVDKTKHTLKEFNEMFCGYCSSITLYIGGSQGVSSCEEVIYYGEDFTTLEDIVARFYQLLSDNACENIEDYLDDLLDGQDPDEIDEDELDELKGEAQAEAECDSGDRYIIVKTEDGGSLYYTVDSEEFIFSHCYYF